MVDDDRLKPGPGERIEERWVRFRTLGCYPLSGAVESRASTIAELIEEMRTGRQSERQGRLIDRDGTASMERKKREGYF
jgi:sulfate adenylyltransferase subunit 2